MKLTKKEMGIINATVFAAFVGNGTEEPFKGASRIVFEKGEAVVPPDAEGHAGVVLSGYVSVFGAAGALINRLSPKSIFGAAGILNEPSHEIKTVMRADGRCTVLFIPKALMLKMLEENFDFCMSYIKFLCSRVAFLNARIDSFTAPTARSRLEDYIKDLYEKKGERITVEGGLTGLSKNLDIGRASLYRALDALVREGIIEKSGRSLKILRPEKL